MPEFEKISPGDELPVLTKEAITEIQLVRYAGASGDFNPLHFMDSFGKAAGQGGVIAHGMLVMGMVGQAITDWVPNRSLKKFNVRFVSVTKPGDVISVYGKVTGKRVENGRGIIACSVKAKDQDGQVKLSGSFEAYCR